MFTLLLQLWGGLFYLLNKLFFSKAERATNNLDKQKWRVRAWTVYLIGLPPWVVIFISERNWIAAAVESSSVPAMLIGLSTAQKGQNQKQPWLDSAAKLMVVIGLGLSLYDFGGITTMNQVLEIGVAAGFLMGTYLLAKEKSQGYFWLMLGNISAASLMGFQGYYVLMIQQILSLGLVIDANCMRRQQYKTHS